jgi:hypothetical protein
MLRSGARRIVENKACLCSIRENRLLDESRDRVYLLKPVKRNECCYDGLIVKSMNTISEKTLNPCNIPVPAIPKRKVFSRRKVRVQFCVNSSLDKDNYSLSNSKAKQKLKL